MARVLFWFLLLAAAAVAVALLARISDGYALLVAPPYRIEVSLNFLLLLLIGGYFALYGVVRLVSRALALPGEVRALRRRQHEEHARARLDEAIIALLEGRFRRARQRAEEALALPEHTGLATLVAARAALAIGDHASAEALLARSDAYAASLAVPRLMLAAELELDQGRPADALARLAALRKEAGLHTSALRLEMKALQAASHHGEVPAIVAELVKRKVYTPEEGELLKVAAHAAELNALVHDPGGFRAYWNRLDDHEQRVPALARAAAQGFLAMGADREAADLLARVLDAQWDPDLVLLYARCQPPDALRQLEHAEHWLADHDGDASLLYALGMLCKRGELWGKAQGYLEASLAVRPDWRTEIALGELFVRTGRDREANAHLAAALRLALAELDPVQAEDALRESA